MEFTFSTLEQPLLTPKMKPLADDSHLSKKTHLKQTINVNTLTTFNKLDIDRSIKQ